jgi:hypothetical protein
MKKELEIRLRKLEKRYSPNLDIERVTSLFWLSAEEIRRGLRPGLYRFAPDDTSSPAPPGSVASEKRRVLIAYGATCLRHGKSGGRYQTAEKRPMDHALIIAFGAGANAPG